MNPALRQLSVDELVAEESVQDYLRGRDADAVWAEARAADPAFDARLREAEEVLLALDAIAREPSTAERATLDSVWSRIQSSLTERSAGDFAREAVVAEVPAQARVIALGQTERRRLNRRILAWGTAIAASLLLLFLLQPDGDTWSTKPGQTELVYLPDSSRVWLAPASALTLENYDGQRRLRLEGEAFFEVAPGAPFAVETAEGTVRVLGTSFRVEVAPAALHVRCQTGKVAVERGEARAELAPGASVRSEAGGLGEVRRERPDTEPAPDRAVIVARDATVGELAARLGRYYDRAAAAAPEIEARRLTIELPTDDLAEATRRLEFVLQTRVDTLDNRLHVGAQ